MTEVSVIVSQIYQNYISKGLKSHQVMHKKIESELVSIAHSILQMKNRDDILALKEKAGVLYEKLSVLAFVDRFVESEPSASKNDILDKMNVLEDATEEEVVAAVKEVTPVAQEIVASEEEEKPKKKSKKKKKKKEVAAEVVVEKEVVEETTIEEVVKEETAVLQEDLFSTSDVEKEPQTSASKNTLEEELKDTISLDLTTDLFENAVRVETAKKSLNDVLVQKNLQIGLNDRIAFVKHLFEGSQEDFNRVVSQLNSFKSEKEAIQFVTQMVKSDYDWSGKEEFEERFITLITRKFA